MDQYKLEYTPLGKVKAMIRFIRKVQVQGSGRVATRKLSEIAKREYKVSQALSDPSYDEQQCECNFSTSRNFSMQFLY